MSLQVRPHAISLALWLNAWRVGNLTLSDTVNACETITDTTEVLKDGSRLSWQAIIETYAINDEPFTVALPQPGDPQGLTAELLSSMDQLAGAVALSRTDLLVCNQRSQWEVASTHHTVSHINIAHARFAFNTHIAEASHILTAAELAGDRTHIDAALDSHIPAHVPPQLPAKLSQALNSAERVRLVAHLALAEAIAFASPSTDIKKQQVLRELDSSARNVMIAVAGHSFTM